MFELGWVLVDGGTNDGGDGGGGWCFCEFPEVVHRCLSFTAENIKSENNKQHAQRRQSSE